MNFLSHLAKGNMSLRLYTNPVLPSAATASHFIEPTGGGYNPFILSSEDWTVVGNQAALACKLWLFTGAIAQESVNGAFLLDGNGELFDYFLLDDQMVPASNEMVAVEYSYSLAGPLSGGIVFTTAGAEAILKHMFGITSIATLEVGLFTTTAGAVFDRDVTLQEIQGGGYQSVELDADSWAIEKGMAVYPKVNFTFTGVPEYLVGSVQGVQGYFVRGDGIVLWYERGARVARPSARSVIQVVPRVRIG